jgi:peroxiredoxin
MTSTRLRSLLLTALAYALIDVNGHAATIKTALIKANARVGAPQFSLSDATGKTLKLSDFRGRVLVLNFWATDCGGCRIEIPWLVDLDKEFKKKEVPVIGISMDISYESLKNAAEAWARVKPFVASHQIGYLMLMGDDETTKRYKVEALPASYLIDSRGRIAATYIGLIDEANVRANIDQLLAEPVARQ